MDHDGTTGQRGVRRLNRKRETKVKVEWVRYTVMKSQCDPFFVIIINRFS